jgi:LEA14-like dessication related protein
MKRYAFLACLALGACATTGRLQPPTIRVTDITIDSFTSADAKFTLQVALANPNFREVAVEALAAELRIENVPVGTAQLAAPLRLPSRGEATASMVASADLVSSLRASAEIARRLDRDKSASPGVRYAVTGTVNLEGGVVVPFSRAGEFKLSIGAPAQ